MKDTLLLDRTLWDLCLNAGGSIAMASHPYAVAQDVASAVKLFAGELWYDTAKGVPYWTRVLGKTPSLALIKQLINAAALSVPGVVSAVTFITAVEGRQITGQVQITDENGTTTVVAL